MSSIYYNLRTERQYSASTGLKENEFLDLFEVFNKHYKTKKNNIITGEKPIFSDPKEALFFILFYLKNYPTLQVLGLLFNISDFAAHTYIDYILPALKAALTEKKALAGRLFTDQENFDKTFEGVTDIFIDGTEVPIERAKNDSEQRESFSGKKNSIV